MSKTITIDISDQTDAALEEATREEGIPPEQLISKVLDDFLAARRFRSIRDRMVRATPRTLSDEDVFEQVS